MSESARFGLFGLVVNRERKRYGRRLPRRWSCFLRPRWKSRRRGGGGNGEEEASSSVSDIPIVFSRRPMAEAAAAANADDHDDADESPRERGEERGPRAAAPLR